MPTNLKGVLYLAKQGVHQTPTLPNLRHPAIEGSLDWATTSAEKIVAFAAKHPDHCWCSVAKKGFAAIIDIDNIAWATENGFPWDAVKDSFIVDTPSGGCHIYLWQTEESQKLGNDSGNGSVIVDGEKVVELKQHNSAAASCLMFRSDKEPHGWYKHRSKADIQPFPKALVDWFTAHLPKHVAFGGKMARQFHPDFDRDDYMGWYSLEPNGVEKVHNGVLHCYIPCPFKGDYHTNSRGGDAMTCTSITFGSGGIGFNCFACEDKTMRDLRALWKDEGRAQYAKPVYIANDPDLIFAFAEVAD